jgi:hypothetical protein
MREFVNQRKKAFEKVRAVARCDARVAGVSCAMGVVALAAGKCLASRSFSMRYIVLLMLLGSPCVTLAHRPVAQRNAAENPRSKNDSPQTDLAALLEGRVRAAWEAFQMRDKDRYEEFLADDFQAVEADGEGERYKPRVLREVEHSMYTDYLLQLFQVQPLAPNYAFVTYEATIQFPTGARLRYKRIFVGELWTAENGNWKMRRYQETPVR